jgi:hypothetical protein
LDWLSASASSFFVLSRPISPDWVDGFLYHNYNGKINGAYSPCYVVNGKRPVNAELALRLGRYFGQEPRYWINLQSRYDMDMAEDALSVKVSREVHPLRMAG